MNSVVLTCQQLVELITDYLEGTLPPAEVARFEEHLAGCPHCRAYLDQMRRTVWLVGRISEEHLNPVMRDELLHAFRTWNAST